MELQPDQVVKLTRGARLLPEGDQEESAGSNPGCVLFGNEDSDAVFLSLISRVDTWFREFVFSHCTRGPHKFETEGRLVKRKRARNILSST